MIFGNNLKKNFGGAFTIAIISTFIQYLFDKEILLLQTLVGTFTGISIVVLLFYFLEKRYKNSKTERESDK